jgi:hypothetical protein
MTRAPRITSGLSSLNFQALATLARRVPGGVQEVQSWQVQEPISPTNIV